MKTERRSRDPTVIAMNLLKKYVSDMKEEIFYSEEEGEVVNKKEQPLACKKQEEQTGYQEVESLNKLQLEPYGQLFAQNGIKEASQYSSVNKKESQEEYQFQDDYSLSEESSSNFIQEKELQVKKRKSYYPKRESGRKCRTTITKEKLEEMNRIFREFYQSRKMGSDTGLNLKDIGERLELGYSTVLHKYKQFKDKKEVRGGYLLELGDSKRKYKKSVEVEKLIREALKEGELANAVEISKYIFRTKKIYYSRAVICRHLLSMRAQLGIKGGQSAEGSVSKASSVVEERFQKMLQEQNKLGNVVYCQEVVFATRNLDKAVKCQRDLISLAKKQEEAIYLSVMVVVHKGQLLFYKTKKGFLIGEDYKGILQKIGKILGGRDKIYLLTNKEQIHYDTCKDGEEIVSIMDRYRMKRVFFNFQDGSMGSLKELFSRIKQKLSESYNRSELLQQAIQRQIGQWKEKRDFYL